jgi:diacylglycerol kinase (ATP)
MLISVSNVATTGGGMKIAPDAVPDDGRLDLCLVRAIPRLELARQLPNVMQGRHVTHPAVEMLRARSLTIETERHAALWIDGEVTGTTPARFTLLPASLPMLLPERESNEREHASPGS